MYFVLFFLIAFSLAFLCFILFVFVVLLCFVFAFWVKEIEAVAEERAGQALSSWRSL